MKKRLSVAEIEMMVNSMEEKETLDNLKVIEDYENSFKAGNSSEFLK